MKLNKNLLILLVLVALIIAPMFFSDKDFGGTDDKATEAIQEKDPTYQRWIEPILEPSEEMEALLFTIQAGLGAAIVGYVVGFFRGRSVRGKE